MSWDMAGTVRKALTDKLSELEARAWSRRSTGFAYMVAGIAVAVASIWQQTGQTPNWWLWLGGLAGVVLAIVSATLWVSGWIDFRFFDREIKRAERDWPSSPE
jgi:uncharacterized membrane protein YdcZ (DUF606 family)